MADQVLTMRPSADLQTDWTAVGTGATHTARVSDDVDTSGVRIPASTNVAEQFRLSDVVVPAGQIRWVRPRIRASTSSTSGVINFRLKNTESVGVTGTIWQWDPTIANSTITTLDGPVLYTNPSTGLPWTQAELNGLVVRLAWAATGATVARTLWEIYVDVGYNTAPAVVAVAPADDDPGVAGVQVVSTASPPITWTYSDPESDVQERFVVDLFNEATYSAGGFDPATATPQHTSGEVYSAAATWTTPALDLGWWRAYVRAADVGSSGRYSVRSFTQFQIALDSTLAPNAPLVVATAEPAAHRIRIDVTPQGANPTEFHLVEYLDGIVWRPVRGAALVASAGAIVVYDNESAPGVATSYRAKGAAQAVNGLIYGPPSAVAVATLVLTETLLVDPLSPLGEVVLTLQPTSSEDNEVISMQGRSGVFKALGREDLVTISDVMDSDEWPFIAIVAAAAWPALRALIRAQRVLLLREPNQQRYCRLGDDVTVSELASPGAERRVRATARGKPRP